MLWGKEARSPVATSHETAVVSLPEGDYPVKVGLSRQGWTRPRGRRSGERHWATIEVLGGRGIPVPEALGFPNNEIAARHLPGAAGAEEAVAALRGEVMRHRQRAGGVT